MRTRKLKTKIQIRDRHLGADEPPYIIAEMACAHQGSVETALKLVDVAVEAGANGVQFEIFHPDDNIVPSTEMYKLLQSIKFTPTEWREIYQYARQKKIDIWTFAYDLPSLKLGLELGTDGIKLNSSDASNPDMLVHAAKSGLPTTLGTGACTFTELVESIELALANGGENFILMHGMQNFPTDIESAHLNRIKILKESFAGVVGYADHTAGDSYLSTRIDLVALGMGVRVFEKHFILERESKGIDHQASLTPEELKLYVKMINDAYIAFGPDRLTGLTENERRYRRFQKKALVAAVDIEPGTIITRDMVTFLRTESEPEICPLHVNSVVGKVSVRKKMKFDQIRLKDFAEK